MQSSCHVIRGGADVWVLLDPTMPAIDDGAVTAIDTALAAAKVQAALSAYEGQDISVVAADLRKVVTWAQAHQAQVRNKLPAGVTLQDVLAFLDGVIARDGLTGVVFHLGA